MPKHALALAVAAEWQWQVGLAADQDQLHICQLEQLTNSFVVMITMATDWQGMAQQDSLKVRPFTMPLMPIAATSIDQVFSWSHPLLLLTMAMVCRLMFCFVRQLSNVTSCTVHAVRTASQPKDRSLVIDTLQTYLHADAACC